MKALASTFVPVLFLAACATAPAPTPEARFKQADANGSGTVSRSEATNLMIGEAFAMYDTNKDGVVDQAEYLAGGGTAVNFAKLNPTGSGKVTLAEAQANPLAVEHMAVSFDEADADKNGEVTYAEYSSYLEAFNEAVR